MFTADGENTLEHAEWLEIFQHSVHELHEQLASENRLEDFIGAKVGISIFRLTSVVLTFSTDHLYYDAKVY